MKIYVASSWRNNIQPDVVKLLRQLGHNVYDFKNPPKRAGFGWEQINSEWKTWTVEQWVKALNHPIAIAGFKSDMEALYECDACVLVMPCGKSAHLEWGWACGFGKQTVYFQLEPAEPELMVKMGDRIITNYPDLIERFK